MSARPVCVCIAMSFVLFYCLVSSLVCIQCIVRLVCCVVPWIMRRRVEKSHNWKKKMFVAECNLNSNIVPSSVAHHQPSHTTFTNPLSTHTHTWPTSHAFNICPCLHLHHTAFPGKVHRFRLKMFAKVNRHTCEWHTNIPSPQTPMAQMCANKF